MTGYHFWGSVSSVLFFLTLYGLWRQLDKIYVRKRAFRSGELQDERPTDIISRNRTFFSYFAFYANFVLGFSFDNIDWYLISTRSIAAFVVMLTLFEIARDRKTKIAHGTFLLSFFLYSGLLLCVFFDRSLLVSLRGYVNGLILIATSLLLLGYVEQILLIRKSKKIGGLSKVMYQMFMVKDSTTLLFGISMGLSKGWPLVVMHGIALCCEIVLLWHFRWIKNLERSKQ